MERTSGVRSTIVTGLGLALVVAAVVLGLPGVSVVRADGPPVSEIEAGPTCAAEDPNNTAAAVVGSLQAEIEQLRVAQQNAQAREGFVTLNGRGYNYGPALAADDVARIREGLENRPQDD